MKATITRLHYINDRQRVEFLPPSLMAQNEYIDISEKHCKTGRNATIIPQDLNLIVPGLRTVSKLPNCS